MRTYLAIALSILLSTISDRSSTVFAQGNLTPPGPPAPTMKSLDDIDAHITQAGEKRTVISSLPYTISAAGSYYLPGNLTASGSGAGITISADNVTLDLNGFALIGGGSGIVAGIDVPAAQKNLCIRNGTVRGWTNGGIGAFNATNSLFEKLRVSDNIAPPGAAAGLRAGVGAVIKECIATNNANIGFSVLGKSTVLNCTASGSTGGVGVGDGFLFAQACTVTGCTAQNNNNIGFHDNIGASTFNHCAASGNGNDGIFANAGSSVHDCEAISNGAKGIDVAVSGEAIHCVANSNSGDGIYVTGGIVSSCSATQNSLHGIELGSNARATGNMCLNNTKSGLYSAGNNNTIDGNTATNNNAGAAGLNGGVVVINGTHNIIIRNTASGNGVADFNITSAGNAIGSIINVYDANNGATITSTIPWANFIY